MAEPQASPVAGDDPDLKLDVTFLPDGEGQMRTVLLGAGGNGVLIQPHAEDDGSVRLEVVTGGCDRDELAGLLYIIAVTLDPSLEEPDDDAI